MQTQNITDIQLEDKNLKSVRSELEAEIAALKSSIENQASLELLAVRHVSALGGKIPDDGRLDNVDFSEPPPAEAYLEGAWHSVEDLESWIPYWKFNPPRRTRGGTKQENSMRDEISAREDKLYRELLYERRRSLCEKLPGLHNLRYQKGKPNPDAVISIKPTPAKHDTKDTDATFFRAVECLLSMPGMNKMCQPVAKWGFYRLLAHWRYMYATESLKLGHNNAEELRTQSLDKLVTILEKALKRFDEEGVDGKIDVNDSNYSTVLDIRNGKNKKRSQSDSG